MLQYTGTDSNIILEDGKSKNIYQCRVLANDILFNGGINAVCIQYIKVEQFKGTAFYVRHIFFISRNKGASSTVNKVRDVPFSCVEC